MADSNTLISTGEDTFTVHAPGTYIVTASDGKRTAKGTAIIRENGETVYLSLAFSVAVPTAGASPVYSGEEQEGNFNGADWDIMEAEGISATDAGEYEATFRLNEPEYYAWDDGEDGDERYVTWKIEKATPGAPVLSEYSVSIGDGDDTANVTAEWEGDGELTAYSTDPDVADVYVDYDTIIITYNSDGAASIVVGIAEGDNFKAYEGNGAVINVNAGVDMVATIIVITDTGNAVTLSGPDGVRTGTAASNRAGFTVTNTGSYYITVEQDRRQKTASVEITDNGQTETVTLWMEQVYLTVLSGISGAITVKNSAGAVVYTGETEGEITVTLHGIDTYTATVTDEDGDRQSGTAMFVRDEQSITLTLEDVTELIRLTIPSQFGTLTYDDSDEEQGPRFNNYDAEIMDIDGDVKGTDAKTYYAVFSLKYTDKYIWEDGTTEDKTVPWTIGSVAGDVALNPAVLAVEPGSTATIAVMRNSTGVIRAQSSNDRVATVRVNGDSVIVTGVAEGDAVITVSVDADANHTAASAMCSVKVEAEARTFIMFSSAGAFTLEALGGKHWNGSIYYSTDAFTWDEWNGSTISSGDGDTKYLYLRGLGNTVITGSDVLNARWMLKGADSGIDCSGNLESLLDYIDVENNVHPRMDAYCFAGMFGWWSQLRTAPSLSAPSFYYADTGTEAEYCCAYMFFYCTSLTAAPKLPATTLSSYCYHYMFQECTSLVTPPVLPAEVMKEHCYDGMFVGSAIRTAPELPATELAEWCYHLMFGGCENIAKAPALRASVMKDGCYARMFNGCTSLTAMPELSAMTLANYCYCGMFMGCDSLTTLQALPATELKPFCYGDMFYSCDALTTLIELPATTLVEGCYYRMFGFTKTSLLRYTSDTAPYDYRIPAGDGVIGTDAENALEEMFVGCVVNFSGDQTPTINMTYHTNAKPVPAT